MPGRATQDGRVMVERSDKTWSTGEGNSKPLQYSCLENPMNIIKRQKDRTLKDELPGLVGTQYAMREEWRNSSRRNEETEPKQKQHPVMDVSGGESKVWCCKEQYGIRIWNVRSMNHGKFKSVQSLSRIWLFATPWISARQASLSITNSLSSLKLTSIESVMPSNHLILCCPLLPLSGSFQMSRLFASGGQSIGVSASTSVLPMFQLQHQS